MNILRFLSLQRSLHQHRKIPISNVTDGLTYYNFKYLAQNFLEIYKKGQLTLILIVFMYRTDLATLVVIFAILHVPTFSLYDNKFLLNQLNYLGIRFST